MIFVKLGGSLITDKARPMTARSEVIRRCSEEVRAAVDAGARILLGHGSGSFGHHLGQHYRTHTGVRSARDWYGFARVGMVARELNQMVMAALQEYAGLPAVSLRPSASARARAGELVRLDCSVAKRLLEVGALPVVFGDVALDEEWGGTIVSTEQVLSYLARRLRPKRIVLAGEVDGVYDADPATGGATHLYSTITEEDYGQVVARLGAARGADVTGGMVDKVRRMHELVGELPGLEVQLVNGTVPGLLQRSILGEAPGEGTTIARTGG